MQIPQHSGRNRLLCLENIEIEFWNFYKFGVERINRSEFPRIEISRMFSV